MVTIKQINSIIDIQYLQELATKSNYDVFIHSLDDSVMIDAKSFMGLWALDFSKPIKIVSEDEDIHKIIRSQCL